MVNTMLVIFWKWGEFNVSVFEPGRKTRHYRISNKRAAGLRQLLQQMGYVESTTAFIRLVGGESWAKDLA